MADPYIFVKEFKIDKFNIIVDWKHEWVSLDQVFDPEVNDIEDMARRCDAGIDTHYILRVRAMYDVFELSYQCLGSCYAYNCSPEEDIENGVGGYLEDIVDEVVAEARTGVLKLVAQLEDDFLEEA